jgi:hypothetical protein
VLSIVLGVLVTSSLFVPYMNGFVFVSLKESLFFTTTLLGVTMGFIYGGLVFVPMFLIAVYMGAVRGIRYLSGSIKIDLENSIDFIDSEIEEDITGSEYSDNIIITEDK